MESNTLLPGTLLQGKSYTYTIRKVLGQGTFGITYLATTKVKVAGALGSLETTMQVAIKEFFMRDINGREENTVTTGSQGGVYANYKKKFAREAENLSKLDHPHIVKVLEYFEANNTVYYAMEYVEGGNLDAYITQHNGLPEAECVTYARQIGSALSYMHAHKMLHLDLKPGNIMLRPNKDAVLIDFGLSKQYNENGEPESSTSVGSGTPGYAPLEQANYHEGKDFPVTMDVYALGATMFKMLTGVRPPEASVILNDGFPAYELQKHHVGDALTACVGKAMAALRKDRPQSVEEFLKELQGNGAKTDNEEGTDYETTSDKKNVTEEDLKYPHKSGKKSQNILIGVCIGCLFIVGIIVSVKNNTPLPSEIIKREGSDTLKTDITNIKPYDSVQIMSHKYIKVWRKGLCGVTDSLGNIIIPIVYEASLRDFSYYRLAVCQKGKWGFVDQITGKLVIACQYKEVSNFHLKPSRIPRIIAEVTTFEGKKYEIDTDGKIITDLSIQKEAPRFAYILPKLGK